MSAHTLYITPIQMLTEFMEHFKVDTRKVLKEILGGKTC